MAVIFNLFNIVTPEQNLMEFNYPIFKNNKLQLVSLQSNNKATTK